MKRLKSNKKNLPAKLSDLLEVALDNLRDFTGRGHKANMDHWLTNDRGSACYGCLAGAVMFCELGLRPESGEGIHPFDTGGIIGIDNSDRLFAINCMRTGSFGSALGYTGGYPASEKQLTELDRISNVIMSGYNSDTGRAPIREYRRAVKQLRAVNL